MYSSAAGRGQLRWVLVKVLLLAVLVTVVVGASVYFYGMAPQPYGWWPWPPFGWFLFIPLFFLAFFALRLFWWGWWGGSGWYLHEDSAMQLLRERFARGELTREQFEQMRRDLQG